MKARRKNSNDEWKDVINVQLRDSYWTNADQIEFQHDEEKHWQDVRERAAIAAMQGMLSNAGLVDGQYEYRITVEKAALAFADELVKLLKVE